MRVRARLTRALAASALLFVIACSSMEVRTQKDPGANLATYKTYAWAPQPMQGQLGRHRSILDQTVKETVDRDLAAKGLHEATDGSPDLLVTYHGSARNSVEYGPPTGPGYWGHSGYWRDYDRSYITREGALTLQLIDANTNLIVWEGTAVDAIGDTGASQKQVASAVDALIAKYPAA